MPVYEVFSKHWWIPVNYYTNRRWTHPDAGVEFDFNGSNLKATFLVREKKRTLSMQHRDCLDIILNIVDITNEEIKTYCV